MYACATRSTIEVVPVTRLACITEENQPSVVRIPPMLYKTACCIPAVVGHGAVHLGIFVVN